MIDSKYDAGRTSDVERQYPDVDVHWASYFDHSDELHPTKVDVCELLSSCILYTAIISFSFSDLNEQGSDGQVSQKADLEIHFIPVSSRFTF